jgi:hypothetical protein
MPNSSAAWKAAISFGRVYEYFNNTFAKPFKWSYKG